MEEILEGGVFEGFEAAALADQEAMEAGAAVEDNAGVQEMAEQPDAAAGTGWFDSVKSFINDNEYGQTIWKVAKFVGASAAGASIAFGIMYGLNKAAAKNAADTGNRQPLSQYLASCQTAFEKNGITWTQESKQEAADAALKYPWIDCTA